MGYRILAALSRLPRAVLGILITALGVVEAYLLLLTVVLLKDLTATGADARDQRLENGLNWSLGIFFISITAAVALILLTFVLAYRRRGRAGAS